MRVSRLFIQAALIIGDHLELPEDSAHYVRTVLRLKKAQAIILFNGQGGEYLGELIEASRKQVIVLIKRYIDRDVASRIQIILGLGISRSDRMDWAIQKAVELGVSSITPLVTEHCVIKLSAEKKQQRQHHWQHIIQHACEQSGRTQLVELQPVSTLNEWVVNQQGCRIFLDPFAKNSLATLSTCEDKVTLLSGPEGGFAEIERILAKNAGFIPVQLGPRILRTETAVLAAVASVQMLWGDFSE